MQAPILNQKFYTEPSVFTADNLLREAHRQKSIPEGNVPAICILDPDGDIANYLINTGRTNLHPSWACYHTKLYNFGDDDIEYGIIPFAVGASFAVLVTEELFSAGCKLLISVTLAGQIVPMGQPPYFVLIEQALRDEGTSYHYLPPSNYSAIHSQLLSDLMPIFENTTIQVLRGATWTTDAPFRETCEAIAFARDESILGVEMEAAALYAFAQAKQKAVICFAHITNQMAQIEGDFEKGADAGSRDALQVITLTAQQWIAQMSV